MPPLFRIKARGENRARVIHPWRRKCMHNTMYMGEKEQEKWRRDEERTRRRVAWGNKIFTEATKAVRSGTLL
jgi:hypothetical protein